jgi:hypothetical protein
MNKIELPKDTGIVIQGPSTYANEISNFWSMFDTNIVFSTWKTEPIENILKIERAGIHVELVDMPTFNGYLNINLQSASTFHGLNYLKSKGVKHALKIRSDSFIYGLERLWPKVYNDDISFAHIYNPSQDTRWAYYMENTVHIGMDWIVDYAVFGNIDTLLNIFNYYISYSYPIPPEAVYMGRWLNYKKLLHNFDINYLKQNGMTFFGKYFEETNSTLCCTKHGQDFSTLIKHNPILRLI